MERTEFNPIPPDEVDEKMKKFFPKREQDRKALEDPNWKDLSEELDEPNKT